jgi:glycerol-3-phosphate acyltransferase PlsY
MASFVVYILIAYLIGSIPTAIWYGRIFHHTDIRKHGSGNAGATNTIRTFGKKAGIIVLVIDISKGSLGVLLPGLISQLMGWEIQYRFSWLFNSELGFGLAAALGHIYPVYEKFKGGKGVATLFGVILAISPLSALFAVMSFVLLFILTKRVSVGSILSGVVFAAAYLILTKPLFIGDYVLAIIYPLLIIYTHRSNIKRLLNGTEPKLSLGSKSTAK